LPIGSLVATAKGAALEHLLLRHPFYDRQVPVVLGDHVTLDTGTGAVHTAPGHGLDDYIVGRRYGLEIDNPVGGDGRFLPSTPLFAGEQVFDANAHVIKVLFDNGRLLKDEPYHHSYPHCWRHKTPVIFARRRNGSSAWNRRASARGRSKPFRTSIGCPVGASNGSAA